MGFQKMYGLRGPWGLTAVLQLIYELRKNCCGRVDGWTGHRGSTRGPRGPKKGISTRIPPFYLVKYSRNLRQRCSRLCNKQKCILGWRPLVDLDLDRETRHKKMPEEGIVKQQLCLTTRSTSSLLASPRLYHLQIFSSKVQQSVSVSVSLYVSKQQ